MYMYTLDRMVQLLVVSDDDARGERDSESERFCARDESKRKQDDLQGYN